MAWEEAGENLNSRVPTASERQSTLRNRAIKETKHEIEDMCRLRAHKLPVHHFELDLGRFALNPSTRTFRTS